MSIFLALLSLIPIRSESPEAAACPCAPAVDAPTALPEEDNFPSVAATKPRTSLLETPPLARRRE